MSQTSIINNRVFPSFTVVQSLTGDIGGVVSPDVFNNINLLGGLNITTTGTPLTNTLTFDLDAVIVLTSVTATDFYTDPVTSHIHISGNTIAAGGTDPNIDIEIQPQLGNLLVSSGSIKVSSFGIGIVVSDAVGLLSTIASLDVPRGGTGVATLLDHGLLVGSGVAPVSTIAVGTTGKLLAGVTGADPTWTTTTYPATSAVGDVVYGSALNTYSNLPFVATATRYLSNTGGGATVPAWAQINLANGVTGQLTVPNGGTGAATLTDHGVLIGSGVGAIDATAVGVDGTVLIGNTAADPTWSANPTVTTVYATTFDTNVVAAAVTLAGTTLAADGTDADININITAKGAGTVIIDELTLTTDLAVTEGGTGSSTLLDHGVLVGSGTAAITALAVGGAGVILTGVAGADPTWTTATYPATIAKGVIVVATDTNVIGALASTGTAGQHLTSGGAATVPAWSTSTYADTFGAGVIVVATAANTVGALASTGTAGQILTSGGAATVPAWTTATYPVTVAIGSLLHASAANTVTALTVGATGEILQGNTGAAPSWLAASTDGKILTAHTGGAPTWETPTAGGLTWSVVTGDTAIAAEQGYIANKASVINFTLPVSFAVGKTFRLAGMQAAISWRIVQRANQLIHWDATRTTTTGVGGYLEATDLHDSIEVICIVADLEFLVISSKGNILIV